jgi:WD40 repeat protein
MDERADVFGLGAILTEILTGQPPYVGDDGTEIFRLASRGKLAACFERLDRCGADAELIGLAKNCLELEPAARPRNATALAERVSGYLESVEARLRQTEMERAAESVRAAEERKRRRVSLALAASVVLMVGLVGSGWIHYERQEAEKLAAVAETQKTKAEKATALAEQESNFATEMSKSAEKAVAARDEAIMAKKELERELYLSDMQEARQAYHEGARNRVEELLNKYLPSFGEPDQRGWEWYYWWWANHRHTQSLRRSGNGSPYYDLVIAPDETWFAIREWGDVVRIYDARTRQSKSRKLTVEDDGRIAISPDSRIFAAVSERARVKLWRTEDWTEMRSLWHQREVSSLAFSSDGLLATGDVLGYVTLWDVAEQKQVGEPLETGGKSTCLAFSPDGKRLATGNQEVAPSLLIWDVTARTVDQQLVETLEPVQMLAWTLRGDRSVVAAGFVNGSVRLWDGDTYDDRNLLRADGPIQSLAFSSSGDRLAVGTSRKNEVHVWDTDSGRLVTTAKGHSQAVWGVGFIDNGATVLSSSADGSALVWDVAHSAPFERLPGATPLPISDNSLTFSADGQVLMRGGMLGPTHQWDLSDPEALPLFDPEQSHKRAAYSSNGQYMVVFTAESDDEYRVQVYRVDGLDRKLQRNRLLSDADIDGPPDYLAISEDGQVVAWSQQAKLFWLPRSEDLDQATNGHPVTRLTLSPDGRKLACARAIGRWADERGRYFEAELWDVSGETAGEPLVLNKGGSVNQALFSPDGALLALATWEGHIKLFETGTGEPQGQLRGHAGYVTAIDFSPDGKLLVSGGYDGTIRLWDVDNQIPLLTLTTPERNIVSVAFSPDGQTIASISESGDARLWRGGTEEMQGDRYWKWLADEFRQRAHDQVWPGKFAEALKDYRKMIEVDKQNPVERANDQFTISASKLVSWKPLQDALPDDGTCRFTVQQPLSGWLDPDFDDSAWQSGGPALAKDAMRSGWPTNQIWVRYEIQLTTPLSSPLVFLTYVDGQATMFVNGQEAAKARTKGTQFQIVSSQVPLQKGRNVIAVHCDGQNAYGAIHLAPGTLRSNDEVLSLFAAPEAPLLQHAMIHQTLGNWDEAAACYVTILQNRSQKPAWTDGLGWHTDRSKKLMDLVGEDSSFDVLRQQLPDAQYLWLARGRILAIRNQWQAAQEAFSKYLALATPANGEALSLFAEPEATLLQHAMIHQALGNWDEAATCHVEILQTRSKSPEWTDGSAWKTDRAKMLMQLVESERLFDALRQRLPQAHDLWLARGRCLAIRNRWQAAAAAFTRYLELASPAEIDFEVGFEAACCHLIVDDLEGYHQVANRFRELAGEKPHPFNAFVLARTAGLAAQTPELAKQAVGWGQHGLSNDRRPWVAHALGLALYRAGDHDAAIARLTESLDTDWYDVANQLALALVYHDSGQHEQARQLLLEAHQWRDKQLQRASDGVVQEQVIDWLAVHALLHEAENKMGKQ